MSLALDDRSTSSVVPSSSSRPSAVVDGGSRPVFVDESGRRARWCQRLLAGCTLIAVAFVLTVAVLGVAFVRSAGCDAWAAPDRSAQPVAVSTAAAPGRLASAPRCQP